MKTAHEFYGWLMSRVLDGGEGALRELSCFAGNERELLMKGPAMAAMLCWKERGCETIVTAALANPTSKNLSSAYKLLSAAAAGGPIEPTLLFIHSDELTAAVNAAVANGQLRQPAREYLMDLLQSLDNDDLLIPLGVAFTQLGIKTERGASELIRAISSRWLRVGPSVVKAYATLIRFNADDEPAFQKFFCEHPQILDPMALQVWSQPDFHGLQEPDFVIRRADNSYLVVEIETPAKQLITQADQLSAEATHAERQATDYRVFLDQRISEARQHFPHYSPGAECLAVIGLEGPLKNQQAKSLGNANAARHKVRIAGFDWLAKRAAAIIENMSSGEIDVIKRYRVV
jgi:hypothetical protein